MSQLPVSSSLSSATATGSSVAAAVFDDTSTACPVCLEDLYNDEDVATVIPCGHVFHDACIERALRTQMRNDEHRQFVRSYTAMPSGPGRPSSLLGEPLCPGGRCILCRSRVTGLMKLYLPKPRPAALAEQQANKMHEHMAQLREQAHSAAVRSAKLKRHKERLRDQRGKLLAELSRVKSQLSEIEEENEIIILSARTCRRRPPGNQTASIVSSWVALNAD